MDALLFTSLVNETKALIMQARIQRVDQPSPREIRLRLRKPGLTMNLVLCAGGAQPTMFLTDAKDGRKMPSVAPAFCMLLRRRLVGARITEIEQPPLERLCVFRLSSYDDLGDRTEYELVAEIMGNRSNIVLSDNGERILGVLRPVGASENRFRQLLPGLSYVLPPAVEKTHPNAVTPACFESAAETDKCAQAVLRIVGGFDKRLARLACQRAGLDPDGGLRPDYASRLATACKRMWEESQSAKAAIVCAENGGRVVWCHVIEPFECETRLTFDTISKALEYAHTERTIALKFENRLRAFQQSLAAHIQKTSRRINARETDLQNAQKRLDLKHKGDLLLTYLHLAEQALRTRQSEFEVPDPSTGKAVPIGLDPSLSASENAQSYYKRYAKARAALKSLRPQLQRDHQELDYLLSVEHSLQMAGEMSDLDELEYELSRQGLGLNKHKQRGHRRVDAEPPEPERFRTSLGDSVLMGKNNRQNDYLTFKIAQPDDMWFHARGYPGAHVVLRTKSKQLSERSIIEAATVAAVHSAGRSSSNVEVDCTRVKHVRKMPGSKPGMVIYENHRTLSVKPDLATIQAMKADETP